MEPEDGIPLPGEAAPRDEQQEVAAGLVKLTVNLVPEAYGALLEASKVTGDTRTDVVNRALSLYAFVEARRSEGWLPAMVSKDGVVKGFDLG